MSSVKSVCSVREKTPQWVSQLFFFSQKNTDEQNTQHSTETLSQPISQNLTAIFGSYVLWYLYAGGVLWDRNCAQKGSVKSVCSVRKKTLQRERKNLYEVCKQPNRGNLTYYAPRHSERGWGWGLCEFCMPEAFCGIETVRKNVLLYLWVLWEKNSPASLIGLIS